ncbi:hypothetical protein NC651_039818 [Populus alba x Populus x berolinensis]|nr:hypothetical protein NC651_039818 [Populus alba x Populus x berolinensis]
MYELLQKDSGRMIENSSELPVSLKWVKYSEVLRKDNSTAYALAKQALADILTSLVAEEYKVDGLKKKVGVVGFIGSLWRPVCIKVEKGKPCWLRVKGNGETVKVSLLGVGKVRARGLKDGRSNEGE